MDKKTYEVDEYTNGCRRWYYKGKLHRENGRPAVEFPNGDALWYLNGELHREDGPAIDCDNNGAYGWVIDVSVDRVQWFLNGERYTDETFKTIWISDRLKEK